MRRIRHWLLLLVPASAFAGDLLSFRQSGGGSNSFQISLERTQVRVDIRGPDRKDFHSVYFFPAQDEMWVADHRKKTLVVMNQSAHQEAQKSLGGAEGRAPKESVTVRAAGLGEKTGKWTATRYEMRRGRKLLQEVWTVPFETVGIDPRTFKTLQRMGLMTEKANLDTGSAMFGVMNGGPCATVLLWHAIGGFPVQTRGHSGKEEFVFQLESTSKKDFDPALFDRPKGYTPISMRGKKADSQRAE